MTITTISAKQCAAARALVGWSQDDLARNAQVSRTTIANFEGNTRIEPANKNLLAVIASLEDRPASSSSPRTSTTASAQVSVCASWSWSIPACCAPPFGQGWDLVFPVRDKGKPCQVTIRREIIDDIARGNFPDDRTAGEGRAELPAAVPWRRRRRLGATMDVPPEIALSMADFPAGTFS